MITSHWLTAALLFGAAAAPEEVVLIEDGTERCRIVVPDGASPTVRHAAQELAEYLKRIAGPDVPIATEHGSRFR